MTKQFRLDKAFPTSGEYSQSVSLYRDYETDRRNSPRDAINTLSGNLTGRNFSDYLMAHKTPMTPNGWDIRMISRLQFCRISFDGVGVIIGRDIISGNHVDIDYLYDAILQAYRFDSHKPILYRMSDMEFAIWYTESGKRSRYGKETDGRMIVKKTQPKQYKRNRRQSW